MAHAGGRPTDYTPEMAAKICKLIATTPHGIKTICEKNKDIPSHTTITNWKIEHPEFLAQYLAAKESQATAVVEHLWDEMDMGCDTTEQISMLNLKFRFHQWHLSKLAPKHFGDKKQIEQNVELVVHEDRLKHLK